MRGKLALAASLALVASLFGPVSASNAALVTKTFTITKSDGTPYANVLVGLFGFDRTEGELPIQTEVVRTGSNGIATVQVDEADRYWGYAVQPPAGDYSHAPVSGSLVIGASEAFNLRLKAANTKILVEASDGSDAPYGSLLYYPATGAISDTYSEIRLLRAGGFGLDLSTNLPTTGRFSIQLTHDNAPGNFYREFGLVRSIVGANSAFTLFPDLKFVAGSELQPTTVDGQSLFILRFNGPNLYGSLRAFTGENVSLSSSMRGWVNLLRANSFGDPDPNNSIGYAQLESNGAFQLRIGEIEGSIQGKYYPKFAIAGSHTVPSFIGQPFFIDANGNYSMTQSGPYSSPSVFRYVANLPNPAELLKVKISDPDTSQAVMGFIELYEQSDYGYDWYGPGQSNNGLTSYSLRDGAYDLRVSPSSAPLVSQLFKLIVDQGQFSLKDESGQSVLPNSSGVFETKLIKPNILLKIVKPDDPTDVYQYSGVRVRKVSGDELDENDRYSYARDGLIALKLENGEYNLTVEISEGLLTPRDYSVVVSGSSVTIKDLITNQFVNSVNGIYNLSPVNANVVLRVVDSSGQAILPSNGIYAHARIQKKVSGSWVSQPNSYIYLQENGIFAFRAASTGEYRLTISVYGRSDLAETQYVVTVDNTNTLKNVGDVQLRSSNFRFKVVAPSSSQAIQYADISIEPITAVANEEAFERSFSTGQLAEGGLAFTEAGTYKITVRKPYDLPSNLVAPKTYTLTATSDGQGGFTTSISGLTASSGVFTLSLGTPNVIGVLRASDGSAIPEDSGWIDLQVQKLANNGWQYVSNSNLTRAGEFGFRLDENGTYRVKAAPYNLPDAATTYSESFEITDANRDTTAKNLSSFRLAAPTAKLSVVLPGTGVVISNTFIDVFKVVANQSNSWVETLYTPSSGIANFSALEAGDYEFTVQPDWRNQTGAVSKTYRGTVSGSGPGSFTLAIPGITADANGVLPLSLAAPNISGRIVQSSGAALNLNSSGWVNVQVQKYDQESEQWNWTDARISLKSDGNFSGLVSEAGTFRLRIDPWELTNQTLTYSSTFTITDAGLATFIRNFGDIKLGSPTLSGIVLEPTGSSAVPYSQIAIFDPATGEELWEYNKRADRNGRWAVTLPPGKYSLLARAPWRSINFGDSALLQNIVVAQNGSVTFAGSPVTDTLTVRLSEPTWSGTVVKPTDQQPLANTSVCLWHQEADKSYSSCTSSDASGRWALSKPAVFSGFNSNTVLTIYPPDDSGFAEKRIQGATNLTQALGAFSASGTYTGIVLAPNQPNVAITVKAGSSNAANVWVNVTSPTLGWLGSASTNQNGVAKMYIQNLSGPIEINAYADWIPELNANYSNTRKVMSQADVTAATSDTGFATTVNLATPNLRVVAYKPGATASTPGDIATDSYVWITNETQNEWVASFNTKFDGEGRAYLAPPASGTYRYKLTFEPGGKNDELHLSSTYFVDVAANGALTMTTQSGSTVTAVGGKFPLVLTPSTVQGEVTEPNGSTPVVSSRIYPVDIATRMRLWQNSAYSNGSGKFGMVLPNGSYWLIAEPVWGQTNFSRSERCQVDIWNGNVLTSDSACVTQGKIKLKLRDANVKFRLVHNGQPIPYAHVSFSVGNWYTSASSKSDGTVALMVDPEEIAAENPSFSGTQEIRVWVSPNYDSSGIVGWECNSGDAKPLCNQLADVVIGSSYSVGSNGQLQDVAFAVPNTKLRVTAPGSSSVFKKDSWVTVFKQEQGWLNWLGGDHTNSDGFAEFNLDTSISSDPAARFTVHVNAPWTDRTTAARAVYKDLTYAQLNNGVFALAAPNLKIKVRQPITNKESRWSWVSISKKFVYSDPNWYWQWYDGITTDELGAAALSLESPGRYQLTIHPGSGAKGSMVTCELDVATVNNQVTITKVADACAAGGTISNSELVLTLSAGNLQGKILRPGGVDPVEGAIIFAQAVNDSNQPIAGMTMEAVSASDGAYGLQLSTDYNWQIKVFYVNAPGVTPRLASLLTAVTVTKAELIATKTLNVTLAAQ